ncbi:hypothetical protein OS127_05545 [Corynebacterium sp. P6129]|uniref:leucine-rich repeat domain-containing protein n=1 Tax=Corynebacterium antarcticum TaxID=2800405 RepID=UPI002260F618|nr:hypothetical protein [Corynebacterium antarcticum]MCX7491991.1 hypothetical protein [Corynebacterium antarcticum]
METGNVIPDDGLRVAMNQAMGRTENPLVDVTLRDINVHPIRDLTVNTWSFVGEEYYLVESLRGLEHLTSLRTLDVYEPWPVNLPDRSNLPHLESLHLTSYNGEHLPEPTGSFPALHSIIIEDGGLVDLPAAMFSPIGKDPGSSVSTQLTIENAGHFTTLPDNPGQRPVFRAITISGTATTELPESLGGVTSVESITLKKNPRLSRIPEGLATLSNLTRVDISWSPELSSLPSSLFEVQTLDTLNVVRTGLTGLPSTLGDVSSLRLVDVSHNAIVTLPDSIGRLDKLESFVASANRIPALPSSITALPSLYYLDLSENQLTTLPSGLGAAVGLRFLLLSHNQLNDGLPENISQIRLLEAINLGNNNLTRTPAFLNHRLGQGRENDDSLVNVHLNANPIATVPESVLTSHATIDLEGTNVSPEDPVVQRANEDGSDVAFTFS